MSDVHSEPVSPPPTAPQASEPGLWATLGYRWLWITSLLLGAGIGLTMATQSHFWEVAEYSITTITWIGLANGLGFFVGYLLAALHSDRQSKQRIVRLAARLLAVLSAVVALLELGELLRGDWFYLIAALFGIMQGLVAAVILGWVGDLLPRRLVAKGVVVLSLASIPLGLLSSVPGPLLREESYATLALFAVACFLFLAATRAARRIPVALASGSASETPVYGLKAAARYKWSDARLRTLWLYIVVTGVLAILLQASLSYYLRIDNDFELSQVVWSYAAQALGAFTATLGLAFVIGSSSRWAIYLGAAAISGVTLVAVSLTTNQALLIVFLFPQGAAMAVIALGGQALALSGTRAGYFGRVAALLLIAAYLLNFAAGFISGYLYDWFDGRWSVLAIGLLLMSAAAWLYRQWRGFRYLPDDPGPPVVESAAQVPTAPFPAAHLAPQKMGGSEGSYTIGVGGCENQDSGSDPN